MFRRNSAALSRNALEIDSDLRYQHPSDIGADLRRFERDTESRPAAAKRRAIPIVAITAVLLMAGYFLTPVLLHHKPKLTDKDTIVLADFTNTTKDPVFDGTLPQGLAVQLTIALFEPRLRRSYPERARPHESAGWRAVPTGDRPRGLREDRQHGGPRRFNRHSRNRVCIGSSGQRLPHGGHSGNRSLP